MKQVVLMVAFLLSCFTGTYAQTNSVEIVNNTLCDIVVDVYDIDTPPNSCTTINTIVTGTTITSGNSISFTGYTEFKIDITVVGPGAIPTVYTNSGCGSQSGSSAPTSSCRPLCAPNPCNPPTWTIDADVVGGSTTNWLVDVHF